MQHLIKAEANIGTVPFVLIGKRTVFLQLGAVLLAVPAGHGVPAATGVQEILEPVPAVQVNQRLQTNLTNQQEMTVQTVIQLIVPPVTQTVPVA